MKEYVIYGKPSLGGKLIESPVPKPGKGEVLIKVVAAGLNPKDWKWVSGRDESGALDAGDDATGIVEAVGEGVYEYKKGDRVAAFHRMAEPHGTYAEYALAPASTTFLLPPNISFEAGAGLPLSFMTAALALYQDLGLPPPTTPGTKDVGVVIYGGASAVGAYAIQLAKLSGLNPIIAVAGGGIEFVKSLDAATHIVDYRKGKVEEDILAAAGGSKVTHIFDAIAHHGSYEALARVLDASGGGRITLVDPPEKGYAFPESVRYTRTFVGFAYMTTRPGGGDVDAATVRADHDFAYLYYRYLTRLLEEGRFKPHPVEVLEGGFDGILGGVRRLHEGKVSAKKLVVRWVDCCSLGRRCTFAEHYRIS